MRPVVVFDVESLGLHGEGFAVGAVVITERSVSEYRLGQARHFFAEEFYGAYIPFLPDTEDGNWVRSNVIPNLPRQEHNSAWSLRKDFWEFWQKWASADDGAYLIADCAWPVETNFLSACIQDDWINRAWKGPYPLLDLSSVLWARGKDPTAKYDRYLHELPEHHPLMDARQSARILFDTCWPASASDPDGPVYRYKVTAFDGCGNEIAPK